MTSGSPWRALLGLERNIISHAEKLLSALGAFIGILLLLRDVELTQEDVAAAMQRLDSYVDINVDGLTELLELARENAVRNALHPTQMLPGHCSSDSRRRRVEYRHLPAQRVPEMGSLRSRAGKQPLGEGTRAPLSPLALAPRLEWRRT
jgi:hypothetical protein